jgi:trehalose 6-phosphate phosphatase
MRRSAATVPRFPQHACLFLDFDGTLVEFANTPASIQFAPHLSSLIAALHRQLDGALAIVTGRALADLDRHLAPQRFPTAALHGTVRRNPAGSVSGLSSTLGFAAKTSAIRQRLLHWIAEFPGLLLEDKGLALALHFRGLAGDVRLLHTLTRELTALLPSDMELLSGELVVEIRLRGSDKGTAVEAFLAEPPFRGRRPVYLGDDVGDLPAMAVVERHGGMVIAVGERIAAPWRLPTPAHARAWLAEALADRLADTPTYPSAITLAQGFFGQQQP